ncbi:unnamed protein product [Pieris macdunnoughi]|uniref:Uncharacterized protein n=1 Tax=Pieris macdunnoughi TaxID=345717 RepID=A0A821VQN2_9NEOP|nr:unnamed protein product [Pieris macdunnoughi]
MARHITGLDTPGYDPRTESSLVLTTQIKTPAARCESSPFSPRAPQPSSRACTRTAPAGREPTHNPKGANGPKDPIAGEGVAEAKYRLLDKIK